MEGQLEIKRTSRQTLFQWPAWVNLLCIASGVALISAVSVWVVYQSEVTLRENVLSKLRTIQHIEQEAVRQWIKSEQQLVDFLAADDDFAQRLLTAEFETDDARSFFRRKLETVAGRLESKSCLLLTVDRDVVANVGQTWPAKHTAALKDQFDQALRTGEPSFSPVLSANGTVGGRSVDDESFVLVAVAPINHRASDVVGFLVIALNANSEFTKVLGSSRIGDTGETIAVNEAGRIISNSRFDNGSNSLGFFNEPHFDLTQEKRSSTRFELRNERDQRGVETVSVSRWMPSVGIALVTKMDRAEAYAPIIQIRRFMWVLCSLLALTTVAAAVYRWNIYRLEKRAKQSDLDRKILGAYELEEKVGEGGMGVVYKAKHALMRRPTAIKILPPEKSSPAAIERFEREVQYTSQLKHPNTISIYDYGRTNNGLFYYAMELLDGLNLEQLVQHDGKIPDGRILLILRQVCESLQEAHARGLIHRDIKPANIMLCDRGGAVDTIKVLDFGMVRDRSRRCDSANNTLSGTPAYMAPECFADPAGVDVRVDVFAIGAVGFYLLTGTPLLDVDSFSALQRILKTDLGKSALDRIRSAAKDSNQAISGELCHLVSRCVAADREHRIASVTEVLKEISKCQPRSAWDREDARGWWLKAGDATAFRQKTVAAKPDSSSGSQPALDETQEFNAADETTEPS